MIWRKGGWPIIVAVGMENCVITPTPATFKSVAIGTIGKYNTLIHCKAQHIAALALNNT